MPQKYTVVTVPFPPDQKAQLVSRAQKEQRGVSNLIRLIVADYLEKTA